MYQNDETQPGAPTNVHVHPKDSNKPELNLETPGASATTGTLELAAVGLDIRLLQSL